MIDSATGHVALQARSAGETIEPFLFRLAEKPLYGCLHRPTTGSARNCGVVLCQPIGPEYVRSHRAIRQLAGRLARVECTVLRFDGYGCGDSAGDDDDGDVEQWVKDVNAAVDELRTRGRPDEVVVVGLRLGGSLAALAGANRGGIDRMVLWDPVVGGQTHLGELRARHGSHLEYLQTGATDRSRPPADDGDEEILGFTFGPKLVETLAALDLLTLTRAPAPKILVVNSQATAGPDALARYLKSLPAHVEYRHVPDHEIWTAAPDTGVVPGKILQSIVSWIAGTAS